MSVVRCPHGRYAIRCDVCLAADAARVAAVAPVKVRRAESAGDAAAIASYIEDTEARETRRIVKGGPRSCVTSAQARAAMRENHGAPMGDVLRAPKGNGGSGKGGARWAGRDVVRADDARKGGARMRGSTPSTGRKVGDKVYVNAPGYRIADAYVDRGGTRAIRKGRDWTDPVLDGAGRVVLRDADTSWHCTSAQRVIAACGRDVDPCDWPAVVGGPWSEAAIERGIVMVVTDLRRGL